MFKICSTCQEETLFTREPVYDGFKKTGEALTCSKCGQSSTDMTGGGTGKTDPLAALFGEDAAPEKMELFDVEAETATSCRKCKHYVVHPFTQRCSLHEKEVAATDVCPDFEAK